MPKDHCEIPQPTGSGPPDVDKETQARIFSWRWQTGACKPVGLPQVGISSLCLSKWPDLLSTDQLCRCPHKPTFLDSLLLRSIVRHQQHASSRKQNRRPWNYSKSNISVSNRLQSYPSSCVTLSWEHAQNTARRYRRYFLFIHAQIAHTKTARNERLNTLAVLI